MIVDRARSSRKTANDVGAARHVTYCHVIDTGPLALEGPHCEPAWQKMRPNVRILEAEHLHNDVVL